MPQTEKHNGWTNYETWNVALWIGNERGSYSYWQDVAQECLDDAEGETAEQKRENATTPLLKRLKEEIEEGNPLSDQNSMYSDILRAALSEVDWYEIAESWLEDLKPTEAA